MVPTFTLIYNIYVKYSVAFIRSHQDSVCKPLPQFIDLIDPGIRAFLCSVVFPHMYLPG